MADPGTSDSPPQERRGHRGLIVAVVMLLALVWAVAVTVSAGRSALDLRSARASLSAAEQDVRGGDLAGAREQIERAVELAAASSSRLSGVHLLPLRVVPAVGPHLKTVRVLSDAVRDAGGAAERFLVAAERVEQGERESGTVPIAAIDELAAPVRELARTLHRTTAEVEDTRSLWLVGPVATARDSYLELAGPAAEHAALAAELTEVLPTFFGGEETRRYLLGAGTLSELRGSGGLMGSWTTLTASQGELQFEDFVDIDELSSVEEDVTAPSEEYTARYGRYGALRHWRNANLTPDFPSAAQVMMRLWEAQRDEQLDGVIMVDPITFERLAEGLGGLEVPDVGTLAPDEALQFVALDAYVVYDGDPDERKRVLGAVATSAFTQLIDALESEGVPATFVMLADVARGGHLQVYSLDRETQEVFSRAGVAGGLPDVEGEFAGVFVNNIAGNKVDYFTERRLVHEVALLPEGRTRGLITAEFHNTAPSDGYPRYVLGPWTDVTDAGDNLSLISVLCGYGCEFRPLPPGLSEGGTELGRPAVDLRLLLPAEERREVQIRTETPAGWSVEDGQVVVRVHHLVQPTLHDTPLRIAIRIPPGWEPATLPEGAEHDGDDIVWEETVSGLVGLELRLSRADTPDAIAGGPDGAAAPAVERGDERPLVRGRRLP
jgi:hypothetical protein